MMANFITTKEKLPFCNSSSGNNNNTNRYVGTWNLIHRNTNAYSDVALCHNSHFIELIMTFTLTLCSLLIYLTTHVCGAYALPPLPLDMWCHNSQNPFTDDIKWVFLFYLWVVVRACGRVRWLVPTLYAMFIPSTKVIFSIFGHRNR